MTNTLYSLLISSIARDFCGGGIFIIIEVIFWLNNANDNSKYLLGN